MSMRWKVLALVLRARAKMRVMLTNIYKNREKMKLYCHLFPSDYEFEKDTLVQLWMAMGFSTQRCVEDFCMRYFDILLKEQQILLSRIDLLTGKNMYKVDQDQVTTLINGNQLGIQDLYKYTLLENDDNTSGSKSYHIALVANDTIKQSTLQKLKRFGNELKSLLFIHNYGSLLKQIPSDMFLDLPLLQALDLSRSHIVELPRSIGNLRQLRYLDLSFTLIESLPESIDRLNLLQTLKLKGCKHLHELPKGLKELVCLRHLDFDILGQLSFLPKGIGALTELRSMSAFIVDDSEEGCSVRELKTMNNLTGSCCISGLENVSYIDVHEAALEDKKHLTHLQLRWNELKSYSSKDQLDAYKIISNLTLNKSLEELQITCYPGFELATWLHLKEHGKLVSITLFKCENIDLTLCLGLLPNLKYLNIIHMNRVLKIDGLFRGVCESSYAAFPKLEELEIDCMFSVEIWTDVFPNDFQLLSKLIIKQCPKLIGLPFLPCLQNLKHLEISRCSEFKGLPDETLPTSLETLIIDDCPLLNQWCSRQGENWHKIQHVPNIWIDLEDICSTREDGGGDNSSITESSCSSDEDVDEDHNTMIDLEDVNDIHKDGAEDNILTTDAAEGSTSVTDLCSTHEDVAEDKNLTTGCLPHWSQSHRMHPLEKVDETGTNSTNNNKNEHNHNKEMRELEEMFSKLNPFAQEFVPPSLRTNSTQFPHSFVPNIVMDDPSSPFRVFPNPHNRNFNLTKKKSNDGQGKHRMNNRTGMAQREEVIRRTVYVSDIDQQVTEEQLASLFINHGQVVAIRVCGDPNSVLRFAFVEFTDEEGAKAALNLSGTMLGFYPIKVLPSKTAIAPVNPTLLPQNDDEREMCARTVYCTNIDKKVSQAEIKLFFESVCGEVLRLRMLGDHHHSTRIAFVEFVMAESATAALNCSGMVLGASTIRVSPSKTPVRPRAPEKLMH